MKLTSAVAVLAASLPLTQAATYRGTITVTNEAPPTGTCQTPVWVGIHDGNFDTYDGGTAISAPMERLAEDGNNAPIIADFAAAAGGVWDGVVGGAPICPGDVMALPFEIDLVEGATHYFSYASMILPSNDAFVANGNPMAHEIFSSAGDFVPVDFNVMGAEVLDAGSEENDEIPENTAFFGQMAPDTGVVEDSVVLPHPGFMPATNGGILDDPRFTAADFTADGYMALSFAVTAEKVIKKKGTITITNKAPANGTCQTPVWVGIHDGSFDTYDRDAALSPAMERLAEDGNNAPIIADFTAAPGGVWDGVVGGMPICPGDVMELPFEIAPVMGAIHYFSYASMILPSNDAFVANGSPTAHPVISDAGAPIAVDFTVMGAEVLDGGTEVNDELPETTAFFGQMAPDTGVDQTGVVLSHPGFLLAGSGGILDDPRFTAGDFTSADYTMMSISTTATDLGNGVWSISITVDNEAPDDGTCQTPVWVAIHDGSFDTYDRSAPLSPAMERLAEDGNNAPIIADFAAASGGVWDGVVGDLPICPGESATLLSEITLVEGATHYFSYASMVLPSNDAFVANGNPMAHEIFSSAGDFVPVEFDVLGSNVLDGGTEVNDEIPENTAFFGQMTPDTGVVQAGNVVLHPGFMPAGSGGILDDAQFAAGDFTAADYMVMSVSVVFEEEMADVTESPTGSPTDSTGSPTRAPTDDSTGSPTSAPTVESSATMTLPAVGSVLVAVLLAALV